MDHVKIWKTITNATKPIKTLFNLYVLFYLVPTVVLAHTVWVASAHLFTKGSYTVNQGPAILLLCATVGIVIWTACYAIYFTHQRTKNPALYEEGFLTDYSVKGKSDE